jgi:DNA-binding MarR family transcriptional regulator
MKTIFLDEDEQTFLARLAARVAESEAGPVLSEADKRHILLETARQAIKFRRWRVSLFDRAMLGEPAYDLLLALYVAEEDLGQVTASRLSDLADVAQTSALRWLDYLIGKQLIERLPHRHDKRSSVLKLTERGRSALDSLLLQMMRIGGDGLRP